MDHSVSVLANGVRVVFKASESSISHACVVVGAGSRDEPAGKAGLAHFVEHMLFKRTKTRSTSQILNRLELVGADLNAYTTKEYTCVHASFLHSHLHRSLDLFNDILFHSVFPEEEIEKEKGVIADEIYSYRDQPEDAIIDEYEELVYGKHAMGQNILGYPETITAFRQHDLFSFTEQHYLANAIVIGVTGNYSEKNVIALCERLFGALKSKNGSAERKKPSAPKRVTKVEHKPVSQAHCVTGTTAYDLHHPHRVPLLLLNNLLGGTGMSSRLNLEIREKQGIAYTIESSYAPFSDTGLFSIYLGTDAEKMEKALKIVNQELRKLREKPLGSLQLKQAKQRFIGQIALGEENRMGLIISLAKSVLDYGAADTFAEIAKKIETVSGETLRDVAVEILDPQRFTTLLFIPDERAKT